MSAKVTTNPKYGQEPHPCVSCDEPTDFGHGRFVNRIPADAYVDLPDGTMEYRDGFMCEMCAEPQAYSRLGQPGLLCRSCGDELIEDADPDGEDTMDTPTKLGLFDEYAEDIPAGSTCAACDCTLLP